VTLLEERDFPGAGDPTRLLGPETEDAAPFLEGLRARRLVLQRCRACRRWRWPLAPVCPYCRSPELDWEELSGRGAVHSWVRYGRSYLPEFEPLMPYVVLSVALAEGPRMFGRLRARDLEPYIGMPVRAIVERFAGGGRMPAFVADPVGESAAR
jgi:uncharacterized OB-fold protein